MNIIERIEKSAPESAFLRHAKVFAVNHHEKWDETGYYPILQETKECGIMV